MSRIGKRIIQIPSDVKIIQEQNKVRIIGPLGELEKTFSPFISVEVVDNQIFTKRKNDAKTNKQLHGTTNSLIQSMIIGVTQGFTKKLIIKGVGYRGKLVDNLLTINAGYSHPVELKVPINLKVTLPKPVLITVFGIDKAHVGQFAANIRDIRKPNVYSGKGIMYDDEIIIRKEGKAATK